jgi:hypothetical protein
MLKYRNAVIPRSRFVLSAAKGGDEESAVSGGELAIQRPAGVYIK